jgi:phenylalanyl-tRNA synthetase alpha chain
MQAAPPPIRVIAARRLYRRDELDATHSPQFHQIEGFTSARTSASPISKALNFSCANFSVPEPQSIRPHYFPFTEPSLEVYVKSKALKSGERWIEVAGSGVVPSRSSKR